MKENTTLMQREFDSLAMAIEDGRANDDDPRASAFVDLARSRGLAPNAVEVFTDRRYPSPVRERALARLAGRVLADMS